MVQNNGRIGDVPRFLAQCATGVGGWFLRLVCLIIFLTFNSVFGFDPPLPAAWLPGWAAGWPEEEEVPPAQVSCVGRDGAVLRWCAGGSKG